MQQFDQVQKLGKDNVDVALKAVGAMQKNAQVIAVETADYVKRSFEQGTAAMEKLVGVRSLDKAIEIQTDYFRQSYDGFVSQATKMGELYAAFARDTMKPYETAMSRGRTATAA